MNVAAASSTPPDVRPAPLVSVGTALLRDGSRLPALIAPPTATGGMGGFPTKYTGADASQRYVDEWRAVQQEFGGAVEYDVRAVMQAGAGQQYVAKLLVVPEGKTAAEAVGLTAARQDLVGLEPSNPDLRLILQGSSLLQVDSEQPVRDAGYPTIAESRAAMRRSWEAGMS